MSPYYSHNSDVKRTFSLRGKQQLLLTMPSISANGWPHDNIIGHIHYQHRIPLRCEPNLGFRNRSSSSSDLEESYQALNHQLLSDSDFAPGIARYTLGVNVVLCHLLLMGHEWSSCRVFPDTCQATLLDILGSYRVSCWSFSTSYPAFLVRTRCRCCSSAAVKR